MLDMTNRRIVVLAVGPDGVDQIARSGQFLKLPFAVVHGVSEPVNEQDSPNHPRRSLSAPDQVPIVE